MVNVERVIREAEVHGLNCVKKPGPSSDRGVYLFKYSSGPHDTIFEPLEPFQESQEEEEVEEGDKLVPFDDGHTPLLASIRGFKTKLRPVSSYRPAHLQSSPFVASFDCAVPALIADLVYLESTVHTFPTNSWGSYASMEDCREYLKGEREQFTTPGVRAEKWKEFWTHEYQHHQKNPSNASSREPYRRFLCLEVLCGFLLTPPPAGSARSSSPPLPHPADSFSPSLHPSDVLPSNPSRSNIHGFAVWSLASVRSLPHGVSYHIDYGELLRYKTGVIHPPVYAATVQCTRETEGGSNWGGGGYFANTEGLAHYESHGYKGCKLPQGRGAKGVMLDPSPREGNGWVEVPYKYRRGTWHTGELPHQSGEVTYGSLGDDNCGDSGNTGWGRTRVIVGINAFDHVCGPEISKAPEHSDAFNREVRLCQALVAREKKGKAMNFQAVMEGSSAVKKMLVLAKREKVKMELEKEKKAANAVINAWEGGSVRSLVERIAKGGKITEAQAEVYVSLATRGGVIKIDKIDKDKGMRA